MQIALDKKLLHAADQAAKRTKAKPVVVFVIQPLRTQVGEHRRVLSCARSFGIAVLLLEKKVASGSVAWVRGSAAQQWAQFDGRARVRRGSLASPVGAG
jgi:hypothetical protein